MAKLPVSLKVNGDEHDLLIEPRKTLAGCAARYDRFNRHQRGMQPPETAAHARSSLMAKP